jgi:DNA-binding NtrC family response regulator
MKELQMSSLVIVDDEPNVLSAMRRLCQNAAILPAIPEPTITTFTSPVDALAHLDTHRVDIVISDYRMPQMDGASFLAQVKARYPDAARIIMSACSDVDGIVRAVNQAGIFRFVSKPWTDPDLKATIIDVLAHRRLLLENRELADEVRAQRNVIVRQQLELERLERESPGITKVHWSDDGGVLLEE